MLGDEVKLGMNKFDWCIEVGLSDPISLIYSLENFWTE